MNHLPQIYVGIDVLAARRPFTYAAVDDRLRLLTLSQGRMKDVVAFLAGQEGCIAGLNAPLRAGVNGGAARADGLAGRGIGLALPVEVESVTPAWMRRGFALVAALGEIGFRDYPCEEAARVLLETNAEAGFWSLLEHKPYEARSFEGRLQRQLVLRNCGVKINDPMEFFEEVTPRRLLQNLLPLEQIHTPYELNAVMAALTAWRVIHRPEEIAQLGAGECPLVLAVRDGTPVYRKGM